MLPHEQLTLGIAAGLFLYTLLYWAPSRRDVLAAIVAAGLTDLVVVNPHAPRHRRPRRRRHATRRHRHFSVFPHRHRAGVGQRVGGVPGLEAGLIDESGGDQCSHNSPSVS